MTASTRRATHAAALALGLIPAIASPALSQEDEIRPEGAEQVQVVGQKRGFMAGNASSGTKTDTPLIETPQSVTVIPRAQLTEQDAHTLN